MSSLATFLARRLEPLTLEEFAELGANLELPLNEAKARYLLGFALLAPSTHNSSPQAFRLDLPRQRIAVLLAGHHVLKASDPDGREAMISVGAALENLITAAAQYGVDCRFEPHPELERRASSGPSDTFLGTLQILGRMPAPDGEQRQRLLAAMLGRKSIRAEFDDTVTLSSKLVLELTEAAASSDGVSLHLFETPATKFAWGKLEELALKHKLEERAFTRELGDWLLPNEDVHSARGMRGKEFGFDSTFTLRLIQQLRGEVPMSNDQLAFMARAGRSAMTQASAVVVLASRSDDPLSALAVGRLFQRCLLLCWMHGVAAAVHTAVCQVPHARAISRATLLAGKALPSLVFRLGTPRDPADWLRPHSSRPALAEILRGEV